MAGKIKYKKPPIIERVIGVYADINPELFQIKMSEWAVKIRDVYPISNPITEWSLNFKDVNGIPMLDNSIPKAEIIQVFWKLHPNKLRVFGMRLRPSRLVFHLCREDDNIHDFDELYPEMESWIRKWMEHFEVQALKGVTVEYFNRLNSKISPQFMTPDGGLKLADALQIFSNIPGKYVNITQPYDCKIRLIVDAKMPCYFDVRVRADDTDPAHAGVRVDFTTSTFQITNKAITANEALAEIQYAHDIIFEQFSCFFTEKAKESFNPYAISN